MEAQGQEEPHGIERLPDAIAGFRVVRRLATGGTSDVLLAHAKAPEGGERTVVLKLLLAQYKDDPSFERMFALEAAAYARLSHPAIVKLYDFFATGDQLVMVLEHVDGMPLNALRAHLTNAGEVLDDRAVFYLMGRVFAALTAAHAAKDPETGDFAAVIHRDVNPSNVLIHKDGSVKLADFGIAKVTGMAGDTKQGFIKGTFGYMAPEQVRGEQVTVRADVYAATLLLWELLARRRAIQHGALSDLEALRAMAHPNIVSLDVLRGDLPASLRKIIARGLEVSPDNRAVTSAELAKALGDAVPENEGRARLAAAIEKARAPDSQNLSATAPSPSIEQSMAALAASDEQSVPPLPSYSVPAPPMSDSDMVDTKLNANARLPAGSIPDDVPTKPANVSEIALLADDSLELPRFPMPSVSDAPPPLTKVPDTAPDEKDAAVRRGLDHATDPPSSSKRGGARLGGPIAPRPAIPRPTSMAPGEPPPSSKPKLPSAYTPPPLAPPTKSDPALKRPHTMMGGFSAQPHAPTPQPTAASDNAKTEPMHMPPAMTPSPGAPIPRPGADLGRTLAMPGAPPPLPSPAAPQAGPAAFAPTALAMPAIPNERMAPTAPISMRNTMPTAPASFRASSPQIETRRGRGWIIAGIGAFLGTAIVIGVAIYITQTKTPDATATSIATATTTASAAATSTATTTPTAMTATTATTTTPSATASATTTATATPSASAVASSASTSTSAPTSPSIPPGKAAIVAGKSARQHRIFVDEKIAGEGPGTYFVSCGHHAVKVGSSGKLQEIDAPCGESITLQ